MILSLSKKQLQDTLSQVGVHARHKLLVHSSLFLLGKPEAGLKMIVDTLLEQIGHEGTLAVPTFNFGFCKGETYDPLNTPSEKMGIFSEAVRQHSMAMRTKHPMQSMSVVGKLAEEICAIDTVTSFEAGSSFDYLLSHDFDILYLGATLMASSLIHHSEQKFNVPYRYYKDFTSEVIENGQAKKQTYTLYVRDEKFDAKLTTEPIEVILNKRGLISNVSLNYGEIKRVRVKDFLSVLDELLTNDRWALLDDHDWTLDRYKEEGMI